ncbi:MAG: D-alanyl-D-alanine carboxypeptidase, partial [Leptolyngbya sp.]|nr:D-alanyl-D-alanine carboxypeptidase [Candidatus Melainabacteria bacterium]
MKNTISKLTTAFVFTILFSLFSSSAFAFNSMSQGFLVENNTGAILQEQNADVAYNPASAVKILTAYSALKEFGPDHQFETKVFWSGLAREENFTGDIFVKSNDPFLDRSILLQVAEELDRQGVVKLQGFIYVSEDFTFAGKKPGQRSADQLYAEVKKAVLVGSGKAKPGKVWKKKQQFLLSKVKFAGVAVKSTPVDAQSLMVIQSLPLIQLIKDMLSRSDNQMAAKLGALVGGPEAIKDNCLNDFQLSADNFSLQSTSGLGVNRVSPRAMITILKGFKDLLQSHKLTLDDALPVAGIDQGTIYRRFEG